MDRNDEPAANNLARRRLRHLDRPRLPSSELRSYRSSPNFPRVYTSSEAPPPIPWSTISLPHISSPVLNSNSLGLSAHVNNGRNTTTDPSICSMKVEQNDVIDQDGHTIDGLIHSVSDINLTIGHVYMDNPSRACDIPPTSSEIADDERDAEYTPRFIDKGKKHKAARDDDLNIAGADTGSTENYDGKPPGILKRVKNWAQRKGSTVDLQIEQGNDEEVTDHVILMNMNQLAESNEKKQSLVQSSDGPPQYALAVKESHRSGNSPSKLEHGKTEHAIPPQAVPGHSSGYANPRASLDPRVGLRNPYFLDTHVPSHRVSGLSTTNFATTPYNSSGSLISHPEEVSVPGSPDLSGDSESFSHKPRSSSLVASAPVTPIRSKAGATMRSDGSPVPPPKDFPVPNRAPAALGPRGRRGKRSHPPSSFPRRQAAIAAGVTGSAVAGPSTTQTPKPEPHDHTGCGHSNRISGLHQNPVGRSHVCSCPHRHDENTNDKDNDSYDEEAEEYDGVICQAVAMPICRIPPGTVKLVDIPPRRRPAA